MKEQLSDKEFFNLCQLESEKLEFIKDEAEKLLISYNQSIKETTNKSYTLMAFIIAILGYSFKEIQNNNSYYILFFGLIISFVFLIKNVYVKKITMNGFRPKILLMDDLHKENTTDLMKIRVIDNHQNSISNARILLKKISRNFSISFIASIVSFAFFIVFFFLHQIECFCF